MGSFTARATLFEQIGRKLQQADFKRPRPYATAICGTGGTGKTQLALKYIEDHKDKFNPTLWIDAENQETALLSFERCTSALLIEVDRALVQWSYSRDSPAVQAVCRWLQQRNGLDEEWLVVLIMSIT